MGEGHVLVWGELWVFGVGTMGRQKARDSPGQWGEAVTGRGTGSGE